MLGPPGRRSDVYLFIDFCREFPPCLVLEDGWMVVDRPFRPLTHGRRIPIDLGWQFGGVQVASAVVLSVILGRPAPCPSWKQIGYVHGLERIGTVSVVLSSPLPFRVQWH